MRALSTLGLTLLPARRWAPISAGLVVFVAATGACGLQLTITEDTAGQASGDSAAPLVDSAPRPLDSAVDPLGGGDAGADGGADGGPPPLVVQLASGLDRVCVVGGVGSLKCWGRNDQGQLGLGDANARGDGPNEMGAMLPAVDVGPGVKVAQIALGGQHTCAILRGGAVKCWGANGEGELGVGDLLPRGGLAGSMGAALPTVQLGAGRTAKQLALGDRHSCAILDNGSVKCWGRNDQGQLGLGDTRSRGGAAPDTGDALPAINLGNGRTAKSITAGSRHTCAILDNDSLKCWGYNDAGQLGYGDRARRGDRSGDMQALPVVDLGLGRTARAIGAGERHTCALLDDQTVKCWGNAYYGQCGTGDTEDRGDNGGEMGIALKAIELGQNHKAKAIGVGFNYTCVVLDNDELRCFGAGFDAQLGPLPGNATSWGWTLGQMGDALPSIDLGAGAKVTAVAAGDTHTCALLGDEVKCFGKNAYGSLGQGDTTTRGKVAGEMGAALLPVRFF